MKHQHKHWIISLRTASLITPSPRPKFEITIGKWPCPALGQKEQCQGQVRQLLVSLDLDHSIILLPLLEGELRSITESLVGAFPGIMEWSYEEWEEYFRKESDPQQQLHHWIAVARVFRGFTEGKPLTRQIEVFRLLILCNSNPINAEPIGPQREILSDVEVDAILSAYYAQFFGG